MQKSAYEMRMSEWSSDLCSSDLGCRAPRQIRRAPRPPLPAACGRNCRHAAGCRSARAHSGAGTEDVRGFRRPGSFENLPLEQVIRRRAISGSRSEEHTSELQSLMRISYAVFCLKKKKHITTLTTIETHVDV